MNGVNERPLEYAFALYHLMNHFGGWKGEYPIADIGSGGSSFPQVLAESWFRPIFAYDPRFRGMVRMPWHQQIRYVESRFEDAHAWMFAAITCLSTIEHMEDPMPLLAAMDERTMPGGLIVITAPFTQPGEFIEVERDVDPVWGRPLRWWRKAIPEGWKMIGKEYLRYWTWTPDGWERCVPAMKKKPSQANGFMWAFEKGA
jgi:hypothetical protein